MRGDKDHLATNDQAGASGGDVAADVAGLELRSGINIDVDVSQTGKWSPRQDGAPRSETRTRNLGRRGKWQRF